MRIKTDENIGHRAVGLLREAGHDVMSVVEQQLSGAPDEVVLQACHSERRTLITLDRGFGNPLRFASRLDAGIVILELGGSASLQLLLDRLGQFLILARTRRCDGELWIVEPGRVRVRSGTDE